ncbi:MAG: type III secretion system export apparatus subunit SctV [Deltaproteobacteria bacterium]|nr:type III secretion system export apparatus subunit SctV [Deltaproteobacteria bacterium]
MKKFLDIITQGDLVTVLKRYADIGLAVLVMLVVGMMIIPLPTPLLDILLVLNISISVIMLLIAMYIPQALKLASFPTIILVTTMFRLALNVSSTRLILLHAHAGEVIESFGKFVVQGNFVVGAVIFLVLMLVNFLVISKGSERVAEVAARFTLDAMPGKQMSIDADLRAGAFDLDEARRRRNDLGRESQLFGSMDGAMKFVKGDSIAGLIIVAINIVAGIIIGVTQKDMTAGEAVETYSILTIGEGLVAIIPALLMSLCAGLIVTRVASEEEDSNLGKDLAVQVLAQPKAFIIASGFIFAIGMIPGLPGIPFTIVAVVVGGLAYGLKKSQDVKNGGGSPGAVVEQREEAVKEEKKQAVQKAKAQEGQSAQMMPVVTPIALEVAADLVPLVDDTGGSNFLNELIPMMRDGLFYELGVRYPGLRVRGNEGDLPPGSYIIMVNEIPLVMGTVDKNKCLVNDTPDRLRLLGIEAEPAQNPANGNACGWISMEQRKLAEDAGLTTWDAPGYVVLHLSAVLRKNAAEFVGIQETQNMLEQLEQAFPALVKEVVPKAVSPFQLTDILRRLVEEEISIRDLRNILQALAEWGPVENDTVMLTEYVRAALKRYISHKYTRGQSTLIVYLLDPQIEETVRSSVQHTSSGSYLALEPEITQEILAAVRNEVGNLPPSAQQPVVLTTMEIRRYFRKLVELEFPHLAVLSYQELSPEMNIQPIARISLG